MVSLTGDKIDFIVDFFAGPKITMDIKTNSKQKWYQDFRVLDEDILKFKDVIEEKSFGWHKLLNISDPTPTQ